MVRNLLLASCAATIAVPAWAQTSAADREPVARAVADIKDNDVVVTAQRAIGDDQVATTARIGVLGDQDVLDTPFSTNSLTSEFIANQQANSLTDVSENDPSLHSVYGGRDASWTTTFLIRGFQSRSTDDVAVNGPFGLPYRIFVSLLGMAVVALSVSGSAVWMTKRSARLLGKRRARREGYGSAVLPVAAE